MMKIQQHKIFSLVVMALTVVTLSSCLKDDENVSYTTYDDTAITAFMVPKLNKYVHTTTKDGKRDSVYKSTFVATGYAFTIDQQKGLIYNTDSLPYGTDITRVVCSMTALNGGTIALAYKSRAGRDSLVYYVNTDSIDFARLAGARVYSSKGDTYRSYTIRLNVHQQQGNEFSWSPATVSPLAQVAGRKLVACGEDLYLLGEEGGHTAVFRRTGTTFEKLGADLGAGAYLNATALDGTLYVLDGGQLKTSADGRSWTAAAPAPAITRLIGAGTRKLYALSADGIVASADKGATWTPESLDDEASRLPDTDLSLVRLATADTHTETLLLVGTRDGQTQIWSKVEDATSASPAPWTYYPADSYNAHTLPALPHLQVIAYDDALLATGGSLSTFYVSRDQGLTWFADDTYRFAAASEAAFALAADSSNVIYLTLAGDSQVWHARLARTAWTAR